MTERLTERLEPDVTLSISDIRKAFSDPRIRTLMEDCKAKGGEITECVEAALLDTLVEIFDEGAVLEEPIIPVRMKDWIAADQNPEDSEACRPCAIPVTLAWYVGELREKGYPDTASKLEGIGLTSDPLTLAEAMDRIKDEVKPEVRDRLAGFDATTQANVGG